MCAPSRPAAVASCRAVCSCGGRRRLGTGSCARCWRGAPRQGGSASRPRHRSIAECGEPAAAPVARACVRSARRPRRTGPAAMWWFRSRIRKWCNPFVPARAKAEYQPSAADVVHGAGHIGEQVRIAKADAGHQQSDFGARGGLTPRGQCRPTLEIEDVGLSLQRVLADGPLRRPRVCGSGRSRR